MQKKGVSGLIVAVLLLAISLTIGGLVVGWISGYSSDSLDGASTAAEQQEQCNALSYKVVAVRNNNTAVTADQYNKFNVTVENLNTADIKGFLFKYIPTSSSQDTTTRTNNSASDALGDYARKTYYHHDDLNAGSSSGFSKVEITPLIDVNMGQTIETLCTSKTKIVTSSNYASS